MAEKELKVGIGDMKFTRDEGRIITYALGSCIGISFYDPFLRLGALLHIMLPAHNGVSDPNIYKYADSGIRETIRKLMAFGMVKARTTVKIAQRNAAMVKKILTDENMRIVAEDTGGTYARTMLLQLESGDVIIRTFGKPEKHL